MWGKAKIVLESKFPIGITPTHVGKSRGRFQKNFAFWDHPHPCGEKWQKNLNYQSRKGSPPPMWGKVNGNNFISEKERITPTHVGKSSKN